MNPLEYAKRIAYSNEETFMFTYEVAKELSKIPNGVFVECGVAAGAQVIAMAAGAPNKIIYAFDSFQGIPLPSNRDDQMPGIKLLSDAERKSLPNPGEQVLESSGATCVSEYDFMMHIQNSGVDPINIKTVPGWFEHTAKLFGSMQVQISLLRLDGDLYNSTMECLKHLFNRVIKGGYVIIDDWELTGSRAACEDYFSSINYKPDYKFVSNIAYFVK